MCNRQLAAPCVALHNVKGHEVETMKLNETIIIPALFYLSVDVILRLFNSRKFFSVLLKRNDAKIKDLLYEKSLRSKR